jgi:pyruvate,water dikinase
MQIVPQIIPFNQLALKDLPIVGGKNASLGEMIQHLSQAGVKVPGGFATTAQAFRDFLAQDGLDSKIYNLLQQLNVDDIQQLTQTGQTIRDWMMQAPLQQSLVDEIRLAYDAMSSELKRQDFSVAVRSSATAEDLPEASFAGQQETYLNVVGLDNILQSIKLVFASLFNDRAIAYRVHQNFPHEHVALSVGIQYMVRSDLAASGVLFTMDTESGFKDVVFITAAYGLGELVVQGAVNPDEFYVYKPALNQSKDAILRRKLGRKELKMVYQNDEGEQSSVKTVSVSTDLQNQFALNDDDLMVLAKHAVAIENHYGRPMDIEWAKDGVDGQIYILQARPETVQSRTDMQVIERYSLEQTGRVLAEGRSIGQKIGAGPARIIHSLSELHKVKEGDVLISDMTDPDWEPVMKKAAAIVTNRGGRTCHAAIIARELGIPAVVGCVDATETIQDGDMITVSCAEGDSGYVYQGQVPFNKQVLNVKELPNLPIKVMMNVGHPDRAFLFQSIPNSGVGLARLEFLISNTIGIHPRALLEFEQLTDMGLKAKIQEKIAAYASPTEYYIERLKEGIASIAAAFYPKPVIVRLSDFKSNEYANLLGGHLYEPHEENPMLGFRGASRYVSSSFKDCFSMECQAVQRVREGMGLTNVEVMIPFVRTVGEAKNVIHILADNGLRRGEKDLRIIMMCEVPSNALLANEFLQYFDGFSIGSNDLTQLTLGLDRDSGLIAKQFDERDPAVKALLRMAISACKAQGKYIGICGQGPSDHPDFALWLLQEGIESVSLNPDCVIETIFWLAKQSAEACSSAN